MKDYAFEEALRDARQAAEAHRTVSVIFLNGFKYIISLQVCLEVNDYKH